MQIFGHFLACHFLGYFFQELGELFSPIFWSPCVRQTVLTFWIFSIGTQLLFSNLSFHLSVSFMALLSLMIWTFKINLAFLALWLFGLLFPRIAWNIFRNILVNLQQTDGFNLLNIFDSHSTTLFKNSPSVYLFLLWHCYPLCFGLSN